MPMTEARKASQRRYRETHREERAAKQRAYSAEHPDYLRTWRAENRDKVNAYQRQYRAEHFEEVTAREREYRETHREEIAAKQRAYLAEHPDYQRKWYAENRDKVTARERERYASQPPGYAAAVKREYRKTDIGYAGNRAESSRGGARNRGAVIDPELTNAILAQILRDRDSCDFCMTPVALHDRMIDHRQAIYFGGQHTADNIQILCKPCEKQKTSAEKSLIHKLRNDATTQSQFTLAA